jgi:hypothetical protein
MIHLTSEGKELLLKQLIHPEPCHLYKQVTYNSPTKQTIQTTEAIPLGLSYLQKIIDEMNLGWTNTITIQASVLTANHVVLAIITKGNTLYDPLHTRGESTPT